MIFVSGNRPCLRDEIETMTIRPNALPKPANGAKTAIKDIIIWPTNLSIANVWVAQMIHKLYGIKCGVSLSLGISSNGWACLVSMTQASCWRLICVYISSIFNVIRADQHHQTRSRHPVLHNVRGRKNCDFYHDIIMWFCVSPLCWLKSAAVSIINPTRDWNCHFDPISGLSRWCP